MGFFFPLIYTTYSTLWRGKRIFIVKQQLMKNKKKTEISWLDKYSPPESILGRTTFGSNYICESFGVSLYQVCTSGSCNIRPFFLAKLFKLCQVGWGSLVDSNLQVLPQILNRIQVQALTGMVLPGWCAVLGLRQT